MRPLLAAAALLTGATSALAQETPLPPSRIAVPAPPAPDWTGRLSFHVGGGVARHHLNADTASTATFVAGLANELESHIYMEVEAWTMLCGLVVRGSH